MYPPNYYPNQYAVNSYIPCMFCHATIAANSMPAHLTVCPNAHQTSVPVITTTPYGSTQSIQYRRVVRVEKKTVDNQNVRPFPMETNPSLTYFQQNQLPYGSQWNLEDSQSKSSYGDMYKANTQVNYMDRPLPPPPQIAYNCGSTGVQQRVIQKGQSGVVQSMPRPVQQSQPRPVQQSQPRPVQQSQSRPVQQSQPRPVQQSQPRPVQQSQPRPVQQSQPRPVQQSQPRPVQTKPPLSPVKGEVEILHPGSLSDRIKLFDTHSSAPVLPRPTPSPKPPSRPVQPVQPVQPTQQPVQQVQQPVQPVQSVQQVQQVQQVQSVQQVQQPVQPVQQVQQVQQVQSVQQVQQVQPVQQVQQVQPPHSPPSQVEHFEKKDLRNHHPNKLSIPTFVSGQLSLDDILQRRLLQEHSNPEQENTVQQSITDTQVVETRSISIEENPPQLIYTANNGYILSLNKEDVKSLFMANAVLPSTGYFNGVVCVYSDQFCFYYLEGEEYMFIKNMLRSTCVNTRIDRTLASSDSMYYGILIMDKAQEEIMSIWFTTSNERDMLFNTMSYTDYSTNNTTVYLWRTP